MNQRTSYMFWQPPSSKFGYRWHPFNSESVVSPGSEVKMGNLGGGTVIATYVAIFVRDKHSKEYKTLYTYVYRTDGHPMTSVDLITIKARWRISFPVDAYLYEGLSEMTLYQNGGVF